jgi:hypothetical protein
MKVNLRSGLSICLSRDHWNETGYDVEILGLFVFSLTDNFFQQLNSIFHKDRKGITGCHFLIEHTGATVIA